MHNLHVGKTWKKATSHRLQFMHARSCLNIFSPFFRFSQQMPTFSVRIEVF